MGGVFINYRTGDGDWAATFISRELAAEFGSAHVFFASKSIRVGEDFVVRILDRLRQCDRLESYQDDMAQLLRLTAAEAYPALLLSYVIGIAGAAAAGRDRLSSARPGGGDQVGHPGDSGVGIAQCHWIPVVRLRPGSAADDPAAHPAPEVTHPPGDQPDDQAPRGKVARLANTGVDVLGLGIAGMVFLLLGTGAIVAAPPACTGLSGAEKAQGQAPRHGACPCAPPNGPIRLQWTTRPAGRYPQVCTRCPIHISNNIGLGAGRSCPQVSPVIHRVAHRRESLLTDVRRWRT
jgi:hypothetical protein